MTIGRIIEGRDVPVVFCSTETIVSDAVAVLAEKRIGAMPVINDESLVGIISERDVIYRLRELGAPALTLSVGDIMTSPAVTASPETTILEALSLMTRRRIRHLPVVEGREMVALVSIGDLVKYRIDQIESEAQAMRTYIQSA